MLKGVDLDDIAAHRLDDMSGLTHHKTRKRVDSIIHVARSRHSSGASDRGSISSVLSDKPKKDKKDKKFRKTSKAKKVYDHKPHEVFVELDELFKEEGHELAWREKARWIKFEEDLEEGTDRWGKPHVASLTFHSLVELRKHLEHGSVLLDLEENELSNIFHRIVDNMITSDQVPVEHQGEVLRSLLLKHKHVHEKHGLLRNMSTISLGSITGHHGTPKHTQSEVNFRQYKEKHGIVDDSSSSNLLKIEDIKTPQPGGGGRKMSVHFENGNKENEEVKIPMLEVPQINIPKSASDTGPSSSEPIVDIEAQQNVSPRQRKTPIVTGPGRLGLPSSPRNRKISAPAAFPRQRSNRSILREQIERSVSIESTSNKMEGIMRKIPPDAEATTVLVGELDYLKSPALCFVRLAEGTMLDGLTEVPIPVRFLFVLLGPGGNNVDYHELGRCFSTLMSSEHFHETAYKADSMHDILRAMNEFIDDSMVLPAGNWDKDLLLPILRLQNKKMKERQLREQAIKEEEEEEEPLLEGEVDGAVAVVRPKVKAKHVDPLIRTRRVFGGLINDVKRRYPHYLSDFTDALNAQCLAAVFFIFFAALSPAITFGGLLGEKTDNWIGISEMILGTSICGVVFALFSGQPLTIIGVTGPILVFEENLYSFCKSSGIEYLPFRFWVGLWMFIIATICVAAEGSVLVRFFTRFTEEVFAFLISLIFIYEVFNKLTQIYLTHPLIVDYCEDPDMQKAFNENATAYYQTAITEEYTVTGGATSVPITTMFLNNSFVTNDTEACIHKKPPPTHQPNTALLSTILMLGTFLLAYMLKIFRNSKFLGKHARKTLGDFGIPIAIFVMVLLDIAITTVYTQKLDVPNGLVPTDQCKRGWIVNPLGMAKPMQVYWMFAAVLPALLAFILMFMETLITGLIVNKKENKLVKGSGFHLDLLIIGGLACFNSILGLPWVWAATVRSVTHTGALTVFSKTHAPGEKPKLVCVYEQRVTAFLVNLIIGLSIALAPLLKQVPLAVLFGVFLYMGVSSLNGIQMVERCELLLMPVKHHPDVSFVRGLRTWRMHLFTIIQLGCVAILWIVKITPAALAFPFFLILLVPLRRNALTRIFTDKELSALDSSEAGDAAKDEDEYQEAHMPV
ncbi:band 3 anion transport protein-like isoform X2 [Amphiura filiformis]